MVKIRHISILYKFYYNFFSYMMQFVPILNKKAPHPCEAKLKRNEIITALFCAYRV